MEMEQYQRAVKTFVVYKKEVEFDYLSYGIVAEVLEFFTSTGKKEFISEVGDVMWFIAQMCNHMDCEMNSLSMYSKPVNNGFLGFCESYCSLIAKYLRGDFDSDLLEFEVKCLLGWLIDLIKIKLKANNTSLSQVLDSNVKKLSSRKERKVLRGSGSDR